VDQQLLEQEEQKAAASKDGSMSHKPDVLAFERSNSLSTLVAADRAESDLNKRKAAEEALKMLEMQRRQSSDSTASVLSADSSEKGAPDESEAEARRKEHEKQMAAMVCSLDNREACLSCGS